MYRILFVLLALSVVGCTSSGNQTLKKHDSQQISTMVVKGQTTKAEVKAIFGDPSDVDFDNYGREKWTYKHMKQSVKAINFVPVVSLFTSGADVQTKKLVIIFDRDTGIVADLIQSSANEEVKTGIIPQ